MIVSLGVFDTSLDQPVYSIRIAHSHKWTRGLGKLWVVLLDALCSYGILESQIDDAAYNVLKMIQEVVERYEIQLSFDMRILGKLVLFELVTPRRYGWLGTRAVKTYMTASERLFGSKRLLNAVNVTKSGEQCLKI